MLFFKYASFLLNKNHISRSICLGSSDHMIKSISSIMPARIGKNCYSKIANRNIINRNRNTLLNYGKLYCNVISKDQNLYFPEKIVKCSQCCRYFHTSERRNVHPFVWIVFRPVLKLLAALTGRGFRKWWRDLPPYKRKYFLNVIKENRRKISIIIFSVITLSGIYYITHLEEAPITRRKRFMAFNSKQLEKINEFELQCIMESIGNQILSPYRSATRRVQAVVHRILDANMDLEEVREKKWRIAVIDSPVENAFVLPIGYIFVFTGMLKLCTNDDQLGAILSHEIAHCIQNHGAENVSFTHLLDLFSIIIIAAIWTVFPSDVISLLTHWLYEKSLEVFLELPYNRKIEREADYVGLKLAARACFDVRESSAFWAKMAVLQKSFEEVPDIEFLSTHPSHESRSKYLDDLMDEAIKLRSSCGCPQLRYRDPRKEAEAAARMLELTRKDMFKNNPKPVKIFQI